MMQSNSDSLLMQKQFELMMDMNNKKIAAEFIKMNDTIAKLNNEVGELRKFMNENRQPQKTLTNVAPEIKTPVAVKKDETQARPRYGDYKSEDVAIDKFFYFGNKR